MKVKGLVAYLALATGAYLLLKPSVASAAGLSVAKGGEIPSNVDTALVNNGYPGNQKLLAKLGVPYQLRAAGPQKLYTRGFGSYWSRSANSAVSVLRTTYGQPATLTVGPTVTQSTPVVQLMGSRGEDANFKYGVSDKPIHYSLVMASASDVAKLKAAIANGESASIAVTVLDSTRDQVGPSALFRFMNSADSSLVCISDVPAESA